MVRILVVDDEPALRQSLARSLRFEGYVVTTAIDGADALAQLPDVRPDAMVVDIMMPRVDGVDLCQRMRRDAVRDRVRGLDAGADDYLVKPFAHEELLARLRAMLRRSNESTERPPLVVGDLRLDAQSWQVSRGNRQLTLTRTEFGLLEILMAHPKQVLTRAQLYEAVWGANLDGSTNSLDVYIGYLRKKLEAGGETRVLHTVRGVGYVLRPDES